MLTFRQFTSLCMGTLALSFVQNYAHAENQTVTVQSGALHLNDMSAQHETLRLTMDKSELLRLDQAASSVIVGNPHHANVLAETPKLLVIVPRAPGATHIQVLNKKGEVILQRHVIIASPKQNYVRIRRSCAGLDADECQSTQTFYCPDMCHEIAAIDNGADSPSQSDDATAAAQSGSDIGPPASRGAEY